MSDVTRILSQIEHGDPQAAEMLLPLVYDELRKLAAAKLAQERPGQTLQATALVHEAYLRLVGPVGNALRGVPSDDSNSTGDPDSPATSHQPLAPSAWDNRGHFFAAAAEAMRRILVDRVRRRQSRVGRNKLCAVPAWLAVPPTVAQTPELHCAGSGLPPWRFKFSRLL